jgi:oligogalacturonide lyase
MKRAPAFALGLSVFAAALLAWPASAQAQIGRRFPSERKVVVDPVTGVPLTFVTSQPGKGDSKIYQTHHQWTADGKWLVFRSRRTEGNQAMAVNEQTGEMVQVTEHGYSGMLCLADRSMKMYFLRNTVPAGEKPAAAPSGADPATSNRKATGPAQIIEVDLEKLFADSAAGTLKGSEVYERVCGTIPLEWGAGGDMALDGGEEVAYFRVSADEARKHLPPDTKMESAYGPRKMGAGPTGLGRMNLKTGEANFVVAVPFQIGHVQTNPFVPGEIVFCWETGGKSPQRTWTVKGDGTGLRPLYPEPAYDWVTHEAVITKDEVAIAILGHRKPGVNDEWGIAGTREHATGLGIVNLRTREMRIAGQTKSGSGLWHVHGSPDGRWAVGDDFARNIYLIDRTNDEMVLLSAGHKTTAQDHPHPTFSADSTRIEIQSAMLSEDGRSMNICVIPVPESLLKREYTQRLVK